jgi:DNA polymerase-3 subunit delta
MKLKTSEIEAFIRKPNPAVRGVLVFGPDDGLVRERASQLS